MPSVCRSAGVNLCNELVLEYVYVTVDFGIQLGSELN